MEHIIIDDFSTDNSVEQIKYLISKYKYNCIFLENSKNLGIVKTLNKVLKLAKGKYWTGISDDIWEKERLEILIKNLERATFEAPLACSNFVSFTSKKSIISKPYFSKNFKFPIDAFSGFLKKKKVLIPSPTTILNTSILKNQGGYNENLFAEDFDLWLKILSRYKVIYVDKVLVKYRKHKKGVSSLYWTKIVKDCYQSIEEIQNDLHLSKKQKTATLIKKIELSKHLIIIELKSNRVNFVNLFIDLYNGIKEHKSYNTYNRKIRYDILDELMIYGFKRDSFLTRDVNERLEHSFRDPYSFFNLVFLIPNFSKRLDYYILLLIERFEKIKNFFYLKYKKS